MLGQRWPAVLAISAVLFAGLTNAHAHVHLCLDGQEPPASVHVVDSSNHLHEHFDGTHGHDDFDLDVPNEALAKTLKYDSPAIVSTTFWTPVVAIAISPPPVAKSAPSPKPPPYFSRPPPRGPPR
jgi:hypothetical protein